MVDEFIQPVAANFGEELEEQLCCWGCEGSKGMTFFT